jgi:uncharacterized protein (TIGR00730 family)
MDEKNNNSNKPDDGVTGAPESKHRMTPWTLLDLKEATRHRINHISDEFGKGFDLIEKYPKSVTFFGSARVKEGNEHYDRARSLAKRIGEELGYAVISGGGPGIMEASNRGAQEGGAPSLGLTIDLPGTQTTNKYVDEEVDFYYFFSRKVCMSFSAEAYIFFPGGFGTMDEFFEILTLIQTHKIRRVPIFLVGGHYWKHFDSFIYEELLERKMIDARDMDLYLVTDDEEYIINLIKNVEVRGTYDHKTEYNDAKKDNLDLTG